MGGVKRTFNLGDEWVYLKVYSGPKILEKILLNEIGELIERLFNENIIDKFFFIRYFDEDYHLRVRFHIKEERTDLSFLISKLNQIFSPYCQNSVVWKINYDTYTRELERYGANTIVDVETLFCTDSLIIVKALRIIDQGNEEFGEDTRWMYSIKIIMFLFKSFKLEMDFIIKILDEYSEAMISEFRLSKYDKNVLNDLYREKRNKIEMILEHDNNTLIDPILRQFSENEEYVLSVNNISKLAKNDELEVHFTSLIQSIIHMTNNRIFRTNQRQNETYVYYFMSKGLKSYNAKMKINYGGLNK